MNDEEKKMLVEMHGCMREILHSVRRHDKDLYGNGRPGIIARLTKAETILWVICGVAGIGIPVLLAT